MSHIDESTQVRRRLDTLSGPEPPRSGRWDENDLEPDGRAGVWHERLVPERLRGTRWDPGQRGVLALAGVGLLAVLIAGAMALRDGPVTQAVPPVAAVRTEVVASGVPGTPHGATGAGSGAQNTGPGASNGGTGALGAEPGATGTGPGASNTGPGTAGAGPNAAGATPGAMGVASGAAGAGPMGSGAHGPVDPGLAAPPGTDGPTGSNGHSASGVVVVSVVGLVERGGLLRFPTGARVADALAAAAPRRDADLSGLNLAQYLSDGDQIVIGRAGPNPTAPQAGSSIVGAQAQHPDTPRTPSGAPRPTGKATIVNLNTATEAELDALPGIGPVTAKAIIAWRTEHGRFGSVDQLADVQGIGPSRLERLRGLVTV
ncbi:MULTISPECIES: ComEA family DNA-binding protein [unclassified Nocardia]|uniref:ComEA family DNA-binding protein n=1 Tax=unclassified Nocardia TaxID=2637762 RepID=UPI00278C15CF|nr:MULTISPECIES: ComEA family DNA-binding protein [unclassified Nocardia]